MGWNEPPPPKKMFDLISGTPVAGHGRLNHSLQVYTDSPVLNRLPKSDWKYVILKGWGHPNNIIDAFWKIREMILFFLVYNIYWE